MVTQVMSAESALRSPKALQRTPAVSQIMKFKGTFAKCKMIHCPRNPDSFNVLIFCGREVLLSFFKKSLQIIALAYGTSSVLSSSLIMLVE